MLQCALTARRKVALVGHQDQRRLGMRIQLEQQRADALSGRRIEVAGRLICEQHGGRRHEGTRERDALLLSAGELPRVVAFALCQPHAVEGRKCASARIGPGGRQAPGAA